VAIPINQIHKILQKSNEIRIKKYVSSKKFPRMEKNLLKETPRTSPKIFARPLSITWKSYPIMLKKEIRQ
jgi:hypothetical protein